MYIPETDIIEKLHGIGPNIITEIMVEKWFKYVTLKSKDASKYVAYFLDTIPALNVLIAFLFVISPYNVMRLLFIMIFGRRKCSYI